MVPMVEHERFGSLSVVTVTAIRSRTVVLAPEEPSPLGQLRSGGTIVASRGLRTLRRYDSFALVYVVAGGGAYADELGARLQVSAGDAILVAPGLAHRYGPKIGERWDEIYLVFDGPIFDLWRKLGMLDPRRPVRKREPVELWFPRFESFLDAPLPRNVSEATLALTRFLELFAQLVAEELTAPNGDGWLPRALAILGSDLAEPIQLTDVAERVGLGYETFRKRFLAEVGLAPGRYRRRKRIDAARQLLRYPRLTNREIAHTLGFADEFHFSRQFRTEVGVTPRDYRRQGLR